MATLTETIMIIHWLWGDPIFSGRPKWMFLKMGGSPNHSFQYVSIRKWSNLGWFGASPILPSQCIPKSIGLPYSTIAFLTYLAILWMSPFSDTPKRTIGKVETSVTRLIGDTSVVTLVYQLICGGTTLNIYIYTHTY